MKAIIDYILNIDIFIVLPLILTCFELLQIHKARVAEILYDIFNDIHSTENLQNIEWLYNQNLTNYTNLTAQDKRKIDDVIDVFTRISFLCDKRLISKKYFIQMYSGLIIHVWEHVQQYVRQKRIATGVTNYACYYEKMYKHAIKYRIKHNYDVIIR